MINLSDILQFIKGRICHVYGNYENIRIAKIASMDNVTPDALDWISPSRKDAQSVAEGTIATAIVVSSGISYSERLKDQGKVLILVDDPKKAIAEIGLKFFVKPVVAGIHSTATVSKSAKIGSHVYIGPHCVIGDGCEIGDWTRIDGNVSIYDNVVIGHNCLIKSGAVLGGEGFGYEKDENGNLFRFPQLGGLAIGNFVEIGSNSCIDRGALTDTVIGDYTKINNLCHIAHNNKIGKNVVITAHVNISGSNTIEDNVWIAPNSSVRGWLTIGKGAVIGMGAVVTKNIPENETWVGNPAKKMEK